MSSSSLSSSYDEPACLRDVAAFHGLFKAPVVQQPAIPDAKRCALRVNLLQEELNELKVAIEQNDLVEVNRPTCHLWARCVAGLPGRGA